LKSAGPESLHANLFLANPHRRDARRGDRLRVDAAPGALPQHRPRAGGRGGLDAADPNPTYRRFVQRCQRDRGYDVINWQ
jgi:hypothetical protein